MSAATALLEAVPTALYTTDAEGRITFFNEAAARLWGHRPQIGVSSWCGSWRLLRPDGSPMAHDECPMAVALKEGRPRPGSEAILERPDGSRVPFLAFAGPLMDASGKVTGGVNVMIDISGRKQAELDSAWLAAIVSSSDDAIVSKTLDGTITSWNAGATRIFGYSADEMVGESIKRIVPPELQSEEDDILAKLGRGERIDHFDTIRLAKDGSRIAISLTVSPIRDRAGRIIGASKVARDVTERKRHEEMQRLLLEELNHRVKNTLATIQAIASQSMRRSANPSEFVASFSGRVQALARAHDLLVQRKMQGASLLEILRDQVILGAEEETRVTCSGPDITLDARLAVQLALVLHELATNARKYGALSTAEGRLAISWEIVVGERRELFLTWKETGVQGLRAPALRGFGSTLIERSLAANGGDTRVHYEADGLRCDMRLTVPEGGPVHARLANVVAGMRPIRTQERIDATELRGKRILIVEDEPLVAMDLEAELIPLGFIVVGPVSTVGEAERIIGNASLDAALVDANLHGHSVERLAAALTQKSVPFAFATGYGREALPVAFRNAPVIRKPFDHQQVIATLIKLLSASDGGTGVVPLRR